MGLQNEKIAALSFVTADLNYLTPPPGRPRTYTFEPPSGEPKSNIVPELHGLTIHDLRPISKTVTLDREGFALVRQKSSVKDFYDEDEVKKVYYPEAERLIKAATAADRVFVFDHTVRKRLQGAADRDGGLRQPVARVHVDHTEKSGPQRVRDLIPDEAEELLKGRLQIINLCAAHSRTLARLAVGGLQCTHGQARRPCRFRSGLSRSRRRNLLSEI
jgi:hypothetical protein